MMTTVATQIYTTSSGGRLVTVTALVTSVVPLDPRSLSSASAAAAAASASRNLNNHPDSNSSFFSNQGAVAGTFTVVGLVIAGLIIGLGLLLCRRKRARQLNADVRAAAGGAGDGGAGVDRFGDEEEGHNPFDETGQPGGEAEDNQFRPMVYGDENRLSRGYAFGQTYPGGEGTDAAYGGTVAAAGAHEDVYADYRSQYRAEMAEIGRSGSVLASPVGYQEWPEVLHGESGSSGGSPDTQGQLSILRVLLEVQAR